MTFTQRATWLETHACEQYELFIDKNEESPIYMTF